MLSSHRATSACEGKCLQIAGLAFSLGNVRYIGIPRLALTDSRHQSLKLATFCYHTYHKKGNELHVPSVKKLHPTMLTI